MINYDEMPGLVERPELVPRKIGQISAWRDISTPSSSIQEITMPFPQPNNLLSLIGLVSDLKNQDIDVKSLAGGLPPNAPLEYLWSEFYPAISVKLAKEIPSFEALQYGNSRGSLRLRQWAASEISSLSDKQITANEILTLPGSQYGLSNALLTFCAKEGKVALCSTPTYSAFLEAAENPMDIPVIAIESDQEGMIPEKLDETIQLLQTKGIDIGLTYSMVYGNPTGGVMTDKRANELNAICKKNNIPFAVDYAYYRITSEKNEIPRISYLDENCIVFFTASKLYAPGERVAWAVIPDKEKLTKMQATKQGQQIMTSPRNELYFWEYALTQLPERLPTLVKLYEEGIEAGMNAVETNQDIFRTVRPEAGMFLWIEIPKGISTSLELGKIIQENHIAYAPGLWFQPQQRMLPDGTILGQELEDNKMRICVVTEEPEVVNESLNILAYAFRKIAQDQKIVLFTSSAKSDQQIFPTLN